MFFKLLINENKYDGKKLWSTLNKLMGRKARQTPSFIDTGDSFFTKPQEIENYLNDFFV